MSPPDISVWLEHQGMADLLPVFHRHSIGSEVLPQLTDDHLKEMGIPIGTRLKLMAAVRRLQLQRPATTAAVERRHLTVLFVDLVGSTPLSVQLDPEELRDLLYTFHGTINAEVSKLDGYVAQYKGDGALVYFGYPSAHEDDPQRAVMAALAIMRALAALRARTAKPIAAHAGIATGLAVVGDTFGQPSAREYSAIGETPNLAARLSDLAASGEIIVSAQTAQLSGHQFEYVALAPGPLKGIDEPVQAYQVIRERDSDTLFDARRGPIRGPIVGRETEVSQLLQLWSAAEDGRGQVVVVSGVAGIGKSRLAKALIAAIAGRPHTCIVNQCSSYQTRTAFHPLLRQLAQAAGLRQGQAPLEGLNRVQMLLPGADIDDVSVTAALLDIDAPRSAAHAGMTPSELRQRTFDALLAHLLRESAQKPVLWLLEDAHWIDPTTLELLVQSVPRIADAAVLAVITHRPEFDLPLPQSENVHQIHLSRLGLSSVRDMIQSLSGAATVADEVVEQIVARTDGVPLYVEELYRSLVESGVFVHCQGALVANASINDRSIPSSLHDSLMARLDHHGAHKRLAQMASVIGREFDVELLSRIVGMPPDKLELALSNLGDAEIVYPVSFGSPRTYAFKHALVRDAAYESLLLSHREDLHGIVLDALETSPSTPAELLARHAMAASRPARAIEHWMRASREALSRAAFAEAVSHLTTALDICERCRGTSPLLQERLDLLLALGQASIPWRGYSHSETVRVFERASLLAEELADDQRLFWVNYARWVVYYVRGEHLTAHRIASEMLDKAGAASSQGRTLAAIRARGISEMILGQPVAARRSFEDAEERGSELKGRPSDRRMAVAQRFAADPEIATQFHVALTRWALGFPDEGLAISAQAVCDARAMAHVHTLGHALVHGAIVAVVDCNPDLALPLCVEASEFASHHGMALWLGYAQMLQGHALALAGQVEAGVEELIPALRRMRQMETGTMVPLHDAICAWGLKAIGRVEEAKPYAERVLQELHQGCERYFWPDMLIWWARYLALSPGGTDLAIEMTLQESLDEARAQKAPAMALKSATALGEFFFSRGRITDADIAINRAMSSMPSRGDGVIWLAARNLQRSISVSRRP